MHRGTSQASRLTACTRSRPPRSAATSDLLRKIRERRCGRLDQTDLLEQGKIMTGLVLDRSRSSAGAESPGASDASRAGRRGRVALGNSSPARFARGRAELYADSLLPSHGSMRCSRTIALRAGKVPALLKDFRNRHRYHGSGATEPAAPTAVRTRTACRIRQSDLDAEAQGHRHGAACWISPKGRKCGLPHDDAMRALLSLAPGQPNPAARGCPRSAARRPASCWSGSGPARSTIPTC